MDPLTQGALGAVVAQACAPREQTRAAALLGGLSGMAPDLDVLIRSGSDPLLFLEYHRQFTHSLLFIPVGGLLCAAVLYPLVRRRLPFAAVFAYCVIGYATHGLLDACTSYGTQLFWPFSDYRVAWNNVSVVDPAVTIPLVAFVALSAIRHSSFAARLGVVWVVAYLTVGVAQRERAEAFGHSVARDRGHPVAGVVAKPSFGNLLLWKTVYAHGGRYYVDAVRLGWEPTPFSGESIEALDVGRDLPWLRPDTVQARDLERFRWFSDGFIAANSDDPSRVIDVRYSMLPNRIDGLWGIELDRSAPPEAHAAFFTARRMTDETRAQLFRMLWP